LILLNPVGSPDSLYDARQLEELASKTGTRGFVIRFPIMGIVDARELIVSGFSQTAASMLEPDKRMPSALWVSGDFDNSEPVFSDSRLIVGKLTSVGRSDFKAFINDLINVANEEGPEASLRLIDSQLSPMRNELVAPIDWGAVFWPKPGAQQRGALLNSRGRPTLESRFGLSEIVSKECAAADARGETVTVAGLVRAVVDEIWRYGHRPNPSSIRRCLTKPTKTRPRPIMDEMRERFGNIYMGTN
tara:strand:+ start:349 stop:1086 length:738 start_codon:yes stop_codon:yes gene_type:complete